MPWVMLFSGNCTPRSKCFRVQLPRIGPLSSGQAVGFRFSLATSNFDPNFELAVEGACEPLAAHSTW